MVREYCILHHRQSGVAGGHWDLVENPIPYRPSAAGAAAGGEASLCRALTLLAEQGWTPVMDLYHAQAQSGESFILMMRG